jgi:hypothetical protein
MTTSTAAFLDETHNPGDVKRTVQRRPAMRGRLIPANLRRQATALGPGEPADRAIAKVVEPESVLELTSPARPPALGRICAASTSGRALPPQRGGNATRTPATERDHLRWRRGFDGRRGSSRPLGQASCQWTCQWESCEAREARGAWCEWGGTRAGQDTCNGCQRTLNPRVRGSSPWRRTRPDLVLLSSYFISCHPHDRRQHPARGWRSPPAA